MLGYASDTLKKKVEEPGKTQRITRTGFSRPCGKTRGCKPSTRNARLAAIRAFFGFIARQEPSLLPHCQTIHTIPLKRTEYKTVAYLEEKEMQALLNAVDLTSRTGLRDKSLLLLLYNTGARVSEIVELKIPDLRLDGSAQVKLLGKGQKYRSCPLWPETVQALHDYLRQPKIACPAGRRFSSACQAMPMFSRDHGGHHVPARHRLQLLRYRYHFDMSNSSSKRVLLHRNSRGLIPGTKGIFACPDRF